MTSEEEAVVSDFLAVLLRRSLWEQGNRGMQGNVGYDYTKSEVCTANEICTTKSNADIGRFF